MKNYSIVVKFIWIFICIMFNKKFGCRGVGLKKTTIIEIKTE